MANIWDFLEIGGNPLKSLRRSLRNSMEITGNPWQSMAINGNQWKSMAIIGNQWKTMEIIVNQWKSIETH